MLHSAAVHAPVWALHIMAAPLLEMHCESDVQRWQTPFAHAWPPQFAEEEQLVVPVLLHRPVEVLQVCPVEQSPLDVHATQVAELALQT